MGKVIYAMSVSLDGFIEGVDGDLNWSVPDEELHQHFNDLEATFDTLFYGRRLYETMAAFWPTADEDPSSPRIVVEYARIWKSKPKVVFSKTLAQVGWNSRLVRENIVEEVQRLKEQPGKDMSVGGAELASTFMRHGLIDEFGLYIHPVILGAGKPFFLDVQKRINFQLIQTITFRSGVVLLKYQKAD
jgi:dihydrofolate reductase